jgi:hypothetical protein
MTFCQPKFVRIDRNHVVQPGLIGKFADPPHGLFKIKTVNRVTEKIGPLLFFTLN